MTKEYKGAIKYSTPHSLSTAFKEFTESVLNRYEMGVSAVAEATSIASDYVNLSIEDCRKYAEKILATIGLSKLQTLITNRNAFSLKDVLAKIIEKYSSDNSDDDNVSLYDYNLGKDTIVNLEDLMAELNATYHAITVDAAMAAAYDLAEEVTDRLTIVRDFISEKFSNSYIDTSGALNFATNALRKKLPISDFIKSRMVSSGIEDMAEGKITSFEDTSDFHYTGASPASAYSFKSIAGFFGATARVAATAVKALLAGVYGVFKVGSSLFLKGFKYLYETAIDPYDIEQLDYEQGNNTINGWFAQFKIDPPKLIYPTTPLPTHDKFACLVEKLLEGPIHFDMLPCEVICALKPETMIPLSENIMDRLKDILTIQGMPEWLIDQLDTLTDRVNALKEGNVNYSTIMDKLANVAWSDVSSLSISEALYVIYIEQLAIHGLVLQVKIKPVSSKLIREIKASENITFTEGAGYGYKVADIIKLFDNLALRYPNIYASCEDRESELYNSFFSGRVLTTYLFGILGYEASGSFPEYMFDGFGGEFDLFSYNTSVGVKPFDGIPYYKWIHPETKVTNKDFLDLVTNVENMLDMDDHGIFRCLNNIFLEKKNNPMSYAFWPYSQNTVRWYDPSFNIKSDEQNIKRFNQFINTAVTVALVVTAVAVVGFKIRRAAFKQNLKLNGLKMQASQAAAKGELTTKMIRKLKRTQRAAKLLSVLSGNMVTAAAATGLSGLATSDFSTTDIAELIAGTIE